MEGNEYSIKHTNVWITGLPQDEPKDTHTRPRRGKNVERQRQKIKSWNNRKTKTKTPNSYARQKGSEIQRRLPGGTRVKTQQGGIVKVPQGQTSS